MILALQSSDSITHLYLFNPSDASKPVASQDWESGRDLSNQLLARIINFLETHNHSLDDLTGIIIFSGPGSFTSLRIGHSVVNALADSLGIPVVGATGDDWISAGHKAFDAAIVGQPALPMYGSEANITKPKS